MGGGKSGQESAFGPVGGGGGRGIGGEVELFFQGAQDKLFKGLAALDGGDLGLLVERVGDVDGGFHADRIREYGFPSIWLGILGPGGHIGRFLVGDY